MVDRTTKVSKRFLKGKKNSNKNGRRGTKGRVSCQGSCIRGAKKTTRDRIELGKQLKVDELLRPSVEHDVAVPFLMGQENNNFFKRKEK